MSIPSPMSAWISGLRPACALTGYGLLLWLGMSTPLLHPSTIEALALKGPQLLMLVIGLLFSAVGLLPAPSHMPIADAAASRRKARGLATALLIAAGLLAWQVRAGHPDPGWLAVDGVLTVILSLLAMLDPGLRGAASHSSLQAPLGCALALLSGLAMLFSLAAGAWAGDGLAAMSVPSLLLLMLPAVGLKLADWRESGVLRPLSRLQITILSLLFGLPLTCALLMWLFPGLANAGWRLAAAFLLAGFALERAEPTRPVAA